MSLATFPEFSTLTPSDINIYNNLIKNYPPLSDISFQRLITWWGLHKTPRIALLNDNLVIDYFLRGDTNNSGLSLVGTQNVDESICTIFDYLRAKGEKPRLVHVPEFVVNNMDYPELFHFETEREFDEYVVAISNFFPSDNLSSYQRHRIVRFINNAQNKRVKVNSLDLASQANQRLLLNCIDQWPKRGLNNKTPHEHQAIKAVIPKASQLGFHTVCLSIDDEMHAFLLFQAPYNQKYITVEYGMVSYAMPYILNFMVYAFAEWFIEQGVEYANLGMDYGKPTLRIIKLTLGPIDFFRKYTLEPSKEV